MNELQVKFIVLFIIFSQFRRNTIKPIHEVFLLKQARCDVVRVASK